MIDYNIAFLIVLALVYYAYSMLAPGNRDWFVFGLILTLVVMLVNMIRIQHGNRTGRENMQLEDSQKRLKTGDLVLFRTHVFNDLGEYLFRKICYLNIWGDDWTHVGMIYRPPWNDRPYILESTLIGHPMLDHLSDSYKTKGLVLTDYLERVRSYSGCVGVRPISQKLDESAVLRAVSGLTPTFRQSLTQSNSLGCGEMLYQLLHKMGLIDGQRFHPPFAMPYHFSCKHPDTQLRNNIKWGPEILVKEV